MKAVVGSRLDGVAVSSTKSMIGHLTVAAGAVEAIVTALSLRDGRVHPTLNQVSITVRLVPGLAPANIISPYHRIAITRATPMERTVTLAAGEEPANRDFELR